MNTVIDDVPLPFYQGLSEVYAKRRKMIMDAFGIYELPKDEWQQLESDSEHKRDFCRNYIRKFLRLFNVHYPHFIESIGMRYEIKVCDFFDNCLYVTLHLCDDWQDQILAFMTDENNKQWLTSRIESEWIIKRRLGDELSTDYQDWYNAFCYDAPNEQMIGIMLRYMADRANENFGREVSHYEEIGLMDYARLSDHFKRIKVGPGVFSRPLYELELWSRASKKDKLQCDGRMYTDSFEDSKRLIDEMYDAYYDENRTSLEVVYVRQKAYCILRKDNWFLKEWKFVNGILSECMTEFEPYYLI